MNAGTPAAIATERPLAYLPVSLFGSVMGLTALSQAWRLAHTVFGVPAAIAGALGALAVAAFALLALGYLVKAVAAPAAVRAELAHPIAGNMFGTLLISLLLLPFVLAPVHLQTARLSWIVGAIGMLSFAGIMVHRWLSERQDIVYATPAWFVPVVGVLDVPLAVPVLELPSVHGLMVLCLAVGLFLAVPLFTLIFSRLLFEPPLPGPLQPTLLILLAPFAVGASAYIVITGHSDLFAQCLYALGLFMLVVLAGRLRNLGRCCPFKVTWWAISFPLAAMAITGLRMAQLSPGTVANALALALLVLASAAIAGLLARTAIGIARGELRDLSV